MKKSDFALDQVFYTATGKWQCTDIGTRVIVAIHLNQEDAENYNSPPFSIPEVVFDEYDMEGCYLESVEEYINTQLFSDIEDAMSFASPSDFGENSAILDKATGKIYYHSDYLDNDEEETLPDSEFDPAIHIAIPHKNELGLGKELVFEFVAESMPDNYEKVMNIFRKRGAYSRYKDWLDAKGMLDQWYDFETQKSQVALFEWCQENNINIKIKG